MSRPASPRVDPGAASPSLLRPAATLLVVRDGASGMEVLMLRRAERAGDLSSAAYVFPGGTLDAQDRALHACCSGIDDETASARLGLPVHGLDFYVGAIRECFEEAGLLFACDAHGRLADLDRLDAAERQAVRAAGRAGGEGLLELCRRMGWRLAADRLAYHSHWLTPLGLPKRFDTRFFVAEAPPGQTALHDAVETTEHRWVRPAEALDRSGGLHLVPATRRTLQSIAAFASARACVEHALGLREVVRIFPRRATGSAGWRPVMPDEPAYAEIGRVDPQGLGHASYELRPGVMVCLGERVRRLTAPNAGVMTGPGTNSYLVGGGARNEWAVIDPGPDDELHVQALLAVAPGPIRWILATHTHIDHSPAAARLKAATGAQVLGRVADEAARQDASFAPDRLLQHGERLVVGDSELRVLHTPGHASNHLCFLLEAEKLLFTGDHVMQGSTVVINPPDGDMRAYIASLTALLDEDLEWLAPGHGFLMARPHEVLRTLIRHRQHREAKVVQALRKLAPADIEALLPQVYDDVPARLHPVAARSLQAHLDKLVADGRAQPVGDRWQLLR